jgi:hypothetical protein
LCNGRFAAHGNRAFGSGCNFIGLSRDDVVITGPTNIKPDIRSKRDSARARIGKLINGR